MRLKVASRAITAAGHRPGFSLLEIALVLTMLAVVMLLSAAVIVGAFRIEQATSASLNRQSHIVTLADQFRADVSQAVTAPDRVNQITAGLACLILRNVDGRQVVYRWNSDRLERSELVDASETSRRVLIGSEYGTFEFSRAGKDRQILTLRLLPFAGSGSMKRPIEISAALGGDLQ